MTVTESVARVSAAIPGPLFPHIAEPVIGRAFARPGGSCGLQIRRWHRYYKY
jgi:hypothetical protein